MDNSQGYVELECSTEERVEEPLYVGLLTSIWPSQYS